MDKETDGKEVMLEGIGIRNGGIDMSLSGEPVKVFYSALINLFDGSGAENFLTTSIEHGIGPEYRKFEITIRDCKGEKTPADRIAELEQEIQKLKGEK